VPLCHTGPFLTHVVPAVVALRAHILQRMVLDTISDFFRYTGLARERFPSPTEVAIGDDRDHSTISLAPHEAIERSMTDRPLRIHRRRKEPAVFVWFDRLDQFSGDWRHRN